MEPQKNFIQYYNSKLINLIGPISSAIPLPIKILSSVEIYLKEIFNSLIVIDNNVNSWEDKEMNVLIPMAGAGKRFLDAVY